MTKPQTKMIQARNPDATEPNTRGDRQARICDQCSRTFEEGALYNDHSPGIWDEKSKTFLRPSGTVNQGRRPMFKPFATKEAAHTTGPWKITNKRPSPESVNNNANIENDSDWPIALVYSGTHPQRPVSRANARLIAAAPELLAACKNLAQTIECEPKGSPNISAAIQETYTAIAKAEGK